MHGTTALTPTESIVQTLTQHLSTMTETLVTWMLDQPRTLADLEQQVLPLLQHLGQTALREVAALAAPSRPAPTVPCPCGQRARYLRTRPASVTTLLGPVTFDRAYYHCAACGRAQHPLDAQLQICAGSRSAGLDEALALLGATQDSFAAAAHVLHRLTLVQVSPNTVRDATETLGVTLATQQAQQVQRVQAGGPSPTPAHPGPARLYVLMDGVLAHLHEGGWREVKVGCCYHTRSRPDRQRPAQVLVQAEQLSYVTALCEAETFGWHLWCEAARRGVETTQEVVVLGDGAHWIWRIADDLFPQATQILDWYHASQYLWAAGTAIWGLEHPERGPWVHGQLEALWNGEVAAVLTTLAGYQTAGEAVTAALSYYTTHQGRMDYPAYRARGLQVGSGSVESACKQVVSARLKGAGMIWDAPGAEAVAVVRAWLKSGRWSEAMACRKVRQRGYMRAEQTEAVDGGAPSAPRPLAPGAAALPDDVRARVQAELAAEREQYRWRNGMGKQRRQQQWDALRTATAEPTSTA